MRPAGRNSDILPLNLVDDSNQDGTKSDNIWDDMIERGNFLH